MSNQLTSIDFHGQTLLATIQDNVVYTALKPICENIGLSWNAQFERIKRDEVLAAGIRMIRTPTKGGFQDVVCLPLTLLNGWLFGVDTNRVNPQIKDKLIAYKKECYQALFDYWNNGAAANHRLSSADTLPLRNAVSMATGVLRLDYSTIYKMVHQRFGIDEIKELSKEQVEQAVEYVHGLMVKVQNPMSESLSINAQNLAWHTQFIYSWYKAIEEPFRMLSPKLSGEIHGHITHAAIFASYIGKHLGYNGMNPERLSNIHWSVGFH
ncbi:phage antirepressor N-terminal domain-containing protein [Moraxella ovis]|uniref:phage antirepressor N-terminal domain-containing protein n=1 Tax=Moraxella ovis TaxID=29433 RepID=UPI000D8F165E|nr:phage antirepressor N-terminal domain-containing protein [Moraxella ovis]SPX85340.1 P22_AR N-terminal domain [Moraxella ovis]STZ06357.1 P22_AR N-terminal domain [Moraxella ovis]